MRTAGGGGRGLLLLLPLLLLAPAQARPRHGPAPPGPDPACSRGCHCYELPRSAATHAAICSGPTALAALPGPLHSAHLTEPLRSLPADAFPARSGLLELRLSHLGLARVHPRAFHGLAHLRDLDLAYNSLSGAEAAAALTQQSLPELRRLSLRRNPLDQIPRLELSALTALDLGGCGLRALPAGSLAGLPRLRVLRLDLNHLRELPVGPGALPPRLDSWRLQGNPLECSCDLLRLPRALAEAVPCGGRQLTAVGAEELCRGPPGHQRIRRQSANEIADGDEDDAPLTDDADGAGDYTNELEDDIMHPIGDLESLAEAEADTETPVPAERPQEGKSDGAEEAREVGVEEAPREPRKEDPSEEEEEEVPERAEEKERAPAAVPTPETEAPSEDDMGDVVGLHLEDGEPEDPEVPVETKPETAVEAEGGEEEAIPASGDADEDTGKEDKKPEESEGDKITDPEKPEPELPESEDVDEDGGEDTVDEDENVPRLESGAAPDQTAEDVEDVAAAREDPEDLQESEGADGDEEGAAIKSAAGFEVPHKQGSEGAPPKPAAPEEDGAEGEDRADVETVHGDENIVRTSDVGARTEDIDDVEEVAEDNSDVEDYVIDPPANPIDEGFERPEEKHVVEKEPPVSRERGLSAGVEDEVKPHSGEELLGKEATAEETDGEASKGGEAGNVGANLTGMLGGDNEADADADADADKETPDTEKSREEDKVESILTAEEEEEEEEEEEDMGRAIDAGTLVDEGEEEIENVGGVEGEAEKAHESGVEDAEKENEEIETDDGEVEKPEEAAEDIEDVEGDKVSEDEDKAISGGKLESESERENTEGAAVGGSDEGLIEELEAEKDETAKEETGSKLTGMPGSSEEEPTHVQEKVENDDNTEYDDNLEEGLDVAVSGNDVEGEKKEDDQLVEASEAEKENENEDGAEIEGDSLLGGAVGGAEEDKSGAAEEVEEEPPVPAPPSSSNENPEDGAGIEDVYGSEEVSEDVEGPAESPKPAEDVPDTGAAEYEEVESGAETGGAPGGSLSAPEDGSGDGGDEDGSEYDTGDDEVAPATTAAPAPAQPDRDEDERPERFEDGSDSSSERGEGSGAAMQPASREDQEPGSGVWVASNTTTHAPVIVWGQPETEGRDDDYDDDGSGSGSGGIVPAIVPGPESASEEKDSVGEDESGKEAEPPMFPPAEDTDDSGTTPAPQPPPVFDYDNVIVKQAFAPAAAAPPRPENAFDEEEEEGLGTPPPEDRDGEEEDGAVEVEAVTVDAALLPDGDPGEKGSILDGSLSSVANLGSYIVLGAIMAIVVALLAYGVIRSRRQKSQSPGKGGSAGADDAEGGRELQDVSKPLINNHHAGGKGGDETRQPLMTKEQEASLSVDPDEKKATIARDDDTPSKRKSKEQNGAVPEVVVERGNAPVNGLAVAAAPAPAPAPAPSPTAASANGTAVPVANGGSGTSPGDPAAPPAQHPVSPGAVRVVAKELPDTKRPVIIMNRGGEPAQPV